MNTRKLLQQAWGAVFLIFVVAIGARLLWSILSPMLPVVGLILVMIVIYKVIIGGGKFR